MEAGDAFGLYIGFVVLVFFFYSIIKLTIKIARGDVQKGLKANKERINKLEEDHKWRIVKVVYIVLSTLIVLAVAGNAVAEEEALWGEADLWVGLMPVLVGSAIAWAIYRLFLPRLYNYLRPPQTEEKPQSSQR